RRPVFGVVMNFRAGVLAMVQRDGVTLIEVLVAIFVMGLGMIALLTLFPLGVLQMAQAIKDDRTAIAAANAASVAKVWNIRVDDNVSQYYKNPVGTFGLPDASAGSSGYPVYVDP